MIYIVIYVSILFVVIVITTAHIVIKESIKAENLATAKYDWEQAKNNLERWLLKFPGNKLVSGKGQELLLVEIGSFQLYALAKGRISKSDSEYLDSRFVLILDEHGVRDSGDFMT